MSNESLLYKIKSKYILKDLLSLAYDDINSVIRLIKYNKSLLNKLDININAINKLNNYKIETKENKKNPINANEKKPRNENKKKSKFMIIIISAIFPLAQIILFLIYIIFFYKKGKFIDEILKIGYNERKKKFVDFMDKYLLIPYFIFIISFEVFKYLLLVFKIFDIKMILKIIILFLYNWIDLIYYIVNIIKFTFSEKIIKEDYLKILRSLSMKKLKKLDKNIREQLWFYSYDISIIALLSLRLMMSHLRIIYILIKKKNEKKNYFVDEKIKTIVLKEINGIKILDYELPLTFDNLNKNEKNKFIYKKENIRKYKYELKEDQIKLINKINNIRKLNNIPILEYYKYNQVPIFILKEKVEMFFYPNKNLYKYKALNLFIFKYPKNTFKNYIRNEETLNIITNYFLSKISIIEFNNLEYIYIYNTNIVPLTIKIKRHKIRVNENLSDNEFANSKDKFPN